MIEILLHRDRFELYLPMKFIVDYEPLSWGEALWGCRRGIINHQAIAELAAIRIGTEREPLQTLIDLSQLAQEDEAKIEEIAEHLSGEEPPVNEEDVEAKWLRFALAWLIANWRDLPNPPGVLENIVSDFGYPDTIDSINSIIAGVAGAAGSEPQFNAERCLALLKQHFMKQGMPLPSED